MAAKVMGRLVEADTCLSTLGSDPKADSCWCQFCAHRENQNQRNHLGPPCPRPQVGGAPCVLPGPGIAAEAGCARGWSLGARDQAPRARGAEPAALDRELALSFQSCLRRAHQQVRDQRPAGLAHHAPALVRQRPLPLLVLSHHHLRQLDPAAVVCQHPGLLRVHLRHGQGLPVPHQRPRLVSSTQLVASKGSECMRPLGLVCSLDGVGGARGLRVLEGGASWNWVHLGASFLMTGGFCPRKDE